MAPLVPNVRVVTKQYTRYLLTADTAAEARAILEITNGTSGVTATQVTNIHNWLAVTNSGTGTPAIAYQPATFTSWNTDTWYTNDTDAIATIHMDVYLFYEEIGPAENSCRFEMDTDLDGLAEFRIDGKYRTEIGGISQRHDLYTMIVHTVMPDSAWRIATISQQSATFPIMSGGGYIIYNNYPGYVPPATAGNMWGGAGLTDRRPYSLYPDANFGAGIWDWDNATKNVSPYTTPFYQDYSWASDTNNVWPTAI